MTAPPGRIEAHGDFIKDLLTKQRDVILVEIRAQLSERGAPVSTGTVHRFFTWHGITRKKRTRHAIEQYRPDVLRQR